MSGPISVKALDNEHERGHFSKDRVLSVLDSTHEHPRFEDGAELASCYQLIQLVLVSVLFPIHIVLLSNTSHEVATSLQHSMSIIEACGGNVTVEEDP